MKEEMIYVAVNGRPFRTKEDCALYESLIETSDQADGMMRAAGVSTKKVAEYVEVILKWEYSKAEGNWPTDSKVLFDKNLFD